MQTADHSARARSAPLGAGGNGHLKPLDEKVQGIMPCGFFREALEREMLRSDRTNTPLTLLIFSIYDPAGRLIQKEAELQRLAQCIHQCTRRTDLKGWFQNQGGMHLGLMLHNTPQEKTDRILTCVRELFVLSMPEAEGFNQPEPHVHCEIYAYPVSSRGTGDQFVQLSLFDDEALLDMQPSPSERPADGDRRSDNPGLASVPARPLEARSIEEILATPLPWWKRLMDILVSAGSLVVLSPLLVLIALLIKCTSKGPIIFKQQRVGHLGKVFWLWKFRSMRPNADTAYHRKYLSVLINTDRDDGGKPMLKLDGRNPLITPIGRLLRITSLDELPQLVNVLRGDMSLIGPRPCLPYEANEYLHWHHRRFDTVPGLTGLWQVSGKNKTTFRQMIRLDIYYTTHRSFWLDMKIFFLTPAAVLAQVRDEFLPSRSARTPAIETD